jgi:uncharacterized protein (DUF433 family)
VEVVLDRHIEVTSDLPGVKPRPRVAGRRIRVSDIVILHLRLGLPLGEVAARYDLDMASLYAAIAYYFDHQTEIDASIDEDQAFADAMQQANPSLLQERLKALRG